jgi:two-component system cell cycle response regulator DivK
MDLSLPEMDGVEAARRIHAQPKLSQIPIFVISAYLTEAVKADVRAAGCVEIFSKPFEAEALMERITATLTQKPCNTVTAELIVRRGAANESI